MWGTSLLQTFLATQPERFSRCCLHQHWAVSSNEWIEELRFFFFSLPFGLEKTTLQNAVPVKCVFYQDKGFVCNNTLSQSFCCPQKQHSRFKGLSTRTKPNPDVPIAPFCLFLLHLVYIHTFSVPLKHRRFLLSIRIGRRKEEWEALKTEGRRMVSILRRERMSCCGSSCS